MGAGVQLPDPKVTFSEGLGARRALREEGGVVWRLLEEQAGPHLGAGRGSAAHEGQSALEPALDSVPVLWLAWGPPSICTCLSSSVKQ